MRASSVSMECLHTLQRMWGCSCAMSLPEATQTCERWCTDASEQAARASRLLHVCILGGRHFLPWLPQSFTDEWLQQNCGDFTQVFAPSSWLLLLHCA